MTRIAACGSRVASVQLRAIAVKILYCAIDQTVPGTTGGSVHVTAVAEGLAALGQTSTC